MAKKILISNFPDEQLQNSMIAELSEMKPNRTTSLMSLMDVLKAGISKARKSGVGWEKIAEYIAEKTGTEVSPDAVCQSYMTLERERKNKERSADELTYAQLRYRYNTAIKIMKSHGIEESEIDAYITEERKKKQERSKKKNEDEKPQENIKENTVEEPDTKNVEQENLESHRHEQENVIENIIREDKDLS